MKEKILKRIDELISECGTVLALAKKYDTNLSLTDNGGVDNAKYRAFKISALSFLSSVLGGKNIYCTSFDKAVIYFKGYNLSIALELLQKVRKDVEEGWLHDLKGLISSEIFSDFLEMSEHLIEENYKDPAAVIIGSVLEENLRELCTRNNLSLTTTDPKTGKLKHKKADTMNVELCKAGVYNTLTQKSVTAWLDLRNNAAHGKYNEYDIQQVKSLLQSVRDFAVKFL